MKFEWDPRKNDANIRKHGIDFRDAVYAFADPFALNLPDDEHADEERWILLGMISPNRVLVVVHTDRSGDGIRIISARRATRSERTTYESRLQL